MSAIGYICGNAKKAVEIHDTDGKHALVTIIGSSGAGGISVLAEALITRFTRKDPEVVLMADLWLPRK